MAKSIEEEAGIKGFSNNFSFEDNDLRALHQ